MERRIFRVDHLGLVAGAIKDLGIIKLIDARIPPDEKEEISTGEAIAGMIINGLGFSNRPLSLTPQFYTDKALGLFFRSEIKAEHFNRHKLGRSLDKVFNYGCSKLFSEIALDIITKEGVDLTYWHNDTTSFSVTGEYDENTDENAVIITHGHSKDHRPDLKQVVLELICSQDAGIPIMMKSYDGNESDVHIFKEHARELAKLFEQADSPRYLILDSKGYNEENAANLSKLGFVSRMPGTLKLENQVIDRALGKQSAWTDLNDAKNKFQVFNEKHYGMDVRCIVVHSDDARKRAEHAIKKAEQKEAGAIEKQLKQLKSQRFSCEEDSRKALERLSQKWRYHKVSCGVIISHKKSSTKGRPKKDTVALAEYQIEACAAVNPLTFKKAVDQKSCFVLVTNIPAFEQSPEQVIKAYKAQNSAVEQPFGFLKAPVFFAASFFIKKPARIDALLMVMVLTLLVYAVTQRRVRSKLKLLESTLPNQINQPTSKPTLRWIFQMLSGIDQLFHIVNGQITYTIEGMTILQEKIIALFDDHTREIYRSPAWG
jgi:transposase